MSPAVETALRAHARLTGRSQQAILREALDRYLTATSATITAATGPAVADDRSRILATGTILPPRTPYRRTTSTLSAPEGMNTRDLLDRTDRL